MNVKAILKILGIILIIEGFFLFLPLFISLLYSETDYKTYLISGGITIGFGSLLYFVTRKSRYSMGKQEWFLVIVSTWIFFSLFGTLPYLIGKSLPDFTDAFFESISGFTTTGATVITSINSQLHGILFWRSLTQWIGGFSFISLSLVFIPNSVISGLPMFNTGIPGSKVEKLGLNSGDIFKTLLIIYLGFTLTETVLLSLAGMPVFDALCHSLTTVSSGGFSSRQANIGYWESAFIQYIVIFFMILAGISFSIPYYIYYKKYNVFRKNEEFKYYIIFFAGFTLAFFSGLIVTNQRGIENSFREALFLASSFLSTTGFSITNYANWHPVLIIFIVILMFIGASSGSAGGGPKVIRITVLLKNSYYELRRLIHPHAIIPIQFNKQTIETSTINKILVFILFYCLVFFFSVILLLMVLPDLNSSLSSVASCLGNIGPGLGKVGPSSDYAHIATAGKWFLSFLMLLGRLEIFTVLFLLAPSFWKK